MDYVQSFFRTPTAQPCVKTDADMESLKAQHAKDLHKAYLKGGSLALAIRSLVSLDLAGTVGYGVLFLASDYLGEITYQHREQIYRVATNAARDAVKYIQRVSSEEPVMHGNRRR